MQERLKGILDKVLEFWNKYTTKQKTIILSVVAAIVITIILLVFFLSKPQYGTLLGKFETVDDAVTLTQALGENGIKYKQSRDGVSVYVQEKDYTKGLNLMAENKINSDDFGWNWALTNDMSTTEKEKKEKSRLAAQNDLRNYMLKFEGVRDATVYLNQPDEAYTLFEEDKDAQVSITLDLAEEMSGKQAQNLAWWVATAVGSDNTDGIVIMDTEKNLLYGSDEKDLLGGEVSDVEDYKEKLTNTRNTQLKEVLLQSGYDEATIASNYVYDFDKVNELFIEYSTAEGQDQGYWANSYNYSSQGSSGSGGIPGTESNTEETDYMVDNGSGTDTKTTLDKYEYLLNRRETNTEYEKGSIKFDESSLSAVLVRYREYDEETLKEDGTLEDITFNQFMAQNNTRTPIEVDEATINMVAQATGIAADKISITAWEQPVFTAEESRSMNVTNYLMIILAVLIIALLIFVVFRGTAPVEVTETEPELSVEQLLATTKENQSLEDIEFSDKSETRVLIEKFVDENPEAVANLLRNWLQDDWGD